MCSNQVRASFLDKLNECLGSFTENVRVVALGDLNVRVGNESVMDVIGKFGVLGRNDSGNELKLVDEFGRVCERRKLKVILNKSKVMCCFRQVEGGDVGGSGSL